MTVYARWLVKKFWTLVAALLILSAVLVQLGRLLSPMVAEHKTDLTDYLGKQLGVSISVEDLSLQWSGLRPELAFSRLRFISPQQQNVVTVERAQAQIDLLATVMSGQLRMWQVEFDTVNISLAQSELGRWNFSGYENRMSPSASSSGGRSDPFDILLIGRYIHLQNITVDFQLYSGAAHALKLSNMLLQNQDGFHRLSADIKDTQERELVRFVFEGEGDPRDRETFTGRGFLGVDELVLQENLALISGQFESLPVLQGGTLSAQLWLQSSAEHRLSFEGDLLLMRELQQAAPDVPLSHIPQQLSSNLTGHWQPDGGWRLALQDAQLQWSDKTLPHLDVEISVPADQRVITLKSPGLALEPWAALVQEQPQTPDLAKRVLADLNPRGRIRNLWVQVPAAKPQDFTLQANLDQVAIEPRKGIPGITALDGFVSASALTGYVDIDSGAGFSAFFPDVYHDSIGADVIRGQVAWSVAPAANQVLVNSGLLELRGDVGQVAGYFFLDAPIEFKSRPSELILQLGLTESDVLQHRVLVPDVLPASLLNWLDQSLQGGKVPEAGFVMRTYWGLGHPRGRTTQLAITSEQGRLQFDPQTPPLEDFSGYVSLDDQILNGLVTEGRILQSRAANVAVTLNENPQGEGRILHLDGQLQGPAADGLSLLRDTPLRKTIGSAFDQWSLEGEMEAKLKLAIPLTLTEPGHQQDVTVSLQDTTLTLGDLNLQFDALSGELGYSSERGLVSQALSARLWQQPLAASIFSEPAADGLNTELSFQGAVPVAELAGWLRRPEVLFMQGLAPVTASMTISAGDGEPRTRLQLGSNLSGVMVELPGVYGKSSDEQAALGVVVDITAEQQTYNISYRDQASVALRLKDGLLESGLVQLHDRVGDGAEGSSSEPFADALVHQGLRIEGELGTLDGQQWLDVFERYGVYSEQYISNLPQSQPLVVNLDLDIAALFWEGLRFNNLAVTGMAIDGGWALDVQHPVLAGAITWYETQPLQLALDYLRWPAASNESIWISGAEASDVLAPSSAAVAGPQGPLVSPSAARPVEADPLADIDPRTLVPLNFSANEVKFGESDFGRWSFKLQPNELGIDVSGLQADIRNVRLGAKPESSNTGATYSWQRTEQGDRSNFSGMLSSTDLVGAMASWGQNKTIESSRARLLADLSWVGSPAAVTLPELQGDVVMDIEKGRFFQNTGQASNALLRLFGLFNFDSWARRLRLDFSDLYKGGMAFDSIEGRLSFADGQVFLVDPVALETPSAKLQMGGKIHLRDETLNTSMVATLPVGGNATIIAALAAGLPVAAGVYAVSKLFKRQVDRVASVSYSMTGAWSEPSVQFDKLFDNKAARKAADGVRKASAEARARDAATDIDPDAGPASAVHSHGE